MAYDPYDPYVFGIYCIYIIHMIHMIHSNNDYRHMIHMYLVSTLIVVLESPMEIRLKWDHHSGWKKNNNSHGAQPPGTPTRLTLAAASTGGGARLTRGHQGCLGDMDECWRHKKSCPHIIYHNHLLSIENLSETYCIQIYPTLFIYAWSSWSQMSLSRISQLDAEKNTLWRPLLQVSLAHLYKAVLRNPSFNRRWTNWMG